MTYGDTIRAARRAHGKTIEALARTVGVSTMHLWGVEKNRHRPSAALVVRLARALDIDPLTALETSGALEKKEARIPNRPRRNSAPETQARADVSAPLDLDPFTISRSTAHGKE